MPDGRDDGWSRRHLVGSRRLATVSLAPAPAASMVPSANRNVARSGWAER